MPKHGNIFTNWFKSSKQKHKKSQQQYPIKNQSNADLPFEPVAAVKRSPLVPREPTNDSRSDLSPRSRRTSIFGLTFGLASSTGSSRLSLLSGNSKQTMQHKSTSCIETQCSLYEQQHQHHQNGSILRKSSANVETSREANRENVNPQPNAQYNNNHSQPSRSPATPPRKQSKSGSITSVGFLQQLAAQLHPGRTSPRSPNTGSANSSLQNIPSGGTTPTPPRSPTNPTSNPQLSQTNCTTTTTAPLTFPRNSSLKQTSVIFSSLDQGSAFTPISSYNAASTTAGSSQKPFLQRQATTQQQKQIQFQQQHHSNQSYSFQKLAYSQPINEYNQANSPNIMSSGLITTINESFTESNQDSSDAEIVEVFAGEHGKSRTGTLDLVDEQLIFNGPEGEEKTKDNRRPCSPAPFNLTPNEQKSEEASRKDSQPEESVECEAPDRPVKKKTSFADEATDAMDSSMFPKCKLGHRDTLRDSLKDSLMDNLRESMNQSDEIDRLEEGKTILKRKSVDLNELGDSIDQQEQGAEETDSFGELVTNDEDFSLYENRTGLGDDLKFLASMPELCDITFLVGENREPVCAVSAVLGSRSRIFYKQLYGQKAYSNQQYNANPDSDLPPEKSVAERSTRRSIFGGRKESIVEDSSNPNDSKRSREESITGGLLRYSKSKKFKETKDTKLKLFLKRGSEPMLNGLPLHQQIQPPVHQTMIIEEFEPDVFRQLIEYIHTGCVTLQARTLLGLMNAADYYGLDELRKSCMGFVSACITVDTVCALLASAERYIQYKCTKSLVQRVLEFVDNHGNEVLSLGSFALLPEHVVRLILSREELKAEELIKFQAALQWSQRYCDGSPGTADLREVMMGFFECIEFYKIPATVLMREVHPLNIVPDHIIMNALAYQADPKSIDIRKVESPNRFRRMTLPHALNIAGSEMLSNLHRQSLVPLKSERSASTSTSGYNTECSMFSANNTSSGNLGFSASIKRKKGERDEDGPSNENDEPGTGKSKSKEKKDKEKEKQSKVGKRRGSRPFRRALTLFEGKGHHS